MKHLVYIFFLLAFINCNSQNTSSENIVNLKIQQADELTDQEKYNEAIELLNGVESIDAWYLVGFSYLRLRNYEKSIESFEAVYTIDPGYRNTCFNLAQCYLEKTEWTKRSIEKLNAVEIIIGYLTEGISLKTGEIPDDYLAQYHANRGQMLQYKSEYEKAILDFTKAIALDVQGDYYARRASTYHFMGKIDLACMDFKKCKELGSTYNEEFVGEICP